uniref:Cytosolic purine 5'-nucleotidase (Trinotate prediction) n=1 Tax=Myxobolus squamalis TaxID=59785 RepID=A0A6B2G4R4_MYXSQ
MEIKQADSNMMHYRRENSQRIFVNRNIFLEKIQYIGFDMDYTLAEYISPGYEKLIYKHALKRLISMGYPPGIADLAYNPKFATRGVVFDKRYGNFLKVDPYGNIMSAVHGLDYLEITESRKKYRNRFIDIGDIERFVIFNTLFEFASMFLISAVVDYFEKHSEWRLNELQTGVERDSIQIAFKTIFDDVISVFGKIHNEREMKQETIDNISLYIKKDERLPLLLMRIRDFGRKTFLVTNSDFWYTNCVMTYLFANACAHGPKFSDDWKSYFDIIVVEATKPKFFAEGTSMCQVDLSTGKKHIGVFKGKISPGDVFTGGIFL